MERDDEYEDMPALVSPDSIPEKQRNSPEKQRIAEESVQIALKFNPLSEDEIQRIHDEVERMRPLLYEMCMREDKSFLKGWI